MFRCVPVSPTKGDGNIPMGPWTGASNAGGMTKHDFPPISLYIGNDTRQSHIVTYTMEGDEETIPKLSNGTICQWSWVSPKLHFKVSTTDTVARLFCDSWASCLNWWFVWLRFSYRRTVERRTTRERAHWRPLSLADVVQTASLCWTSENIQRVRSSVVDSLCARLEMRQITKFPTIIMCRRSKKHRRLYRVIYLDQGGYATSVVCACLSVCLSLCLCVILCAGLLKK